jgi:TetR/AcrR family transcriptional repressor of lmrAB and yxaGH operons
VQGYHATGLNQVLADGGLPKGSLYFHFPGGKEQLAVESVRLAGDEFGAALRTTLASTPDPAEALERAVAQLGEHLITTDYREGCPVATVALDTAAHNDAVRTACADVYGSWQSLVADHMRAAGVEEPADLATVVISAIEGALLLARTCRDLAPLHAVGTRLRVLLENERSSA